MKARQPPRSKKAKTDLTKRTPDTINVSIEEVIKSPLYQSILAELERNGGVTHIGFLGIEHEPANGKARRKTTKKRKKKR